MDEFLTTITNEVFKRRPVLGEIAQNYSGLKLFDYVKKSWVVPKGSTDGLFFNILNVELANLYGRETAAKVLHQLEKKPLVSTISHMGIWGHPIFVNADLIYSLNFEADEFAVCLATESVSLNNTSSWSGSVLKHEGDNLKRYSFFPDRQKTLPVFSAPAIGDKEVMQFKKKAGGLAEGLLDILQLSEGDNFSQQCCKANARLWNAVFPSAPKLLYLPLETIILKYLLKGFKNQDDIFSKLILTGVGQTLWRKYFGTEHTFMFWGIDGKGRRKILSDLPDKDQLISLMQSRKVCPSSPLCFAVLLFVGLACVGGFNQTTWLTQIKEKFLQLLAELGQTSATEKTSPVPTKNFAESSLAWLNMGGDYLNPTAMDLFLTQKDNYPNFKKLSQSLTLGQSLELAMPDIYSVIVPKNEQGFKFSVLEQERQKLLKQQLTAIGDLI